MYNNVMIDIETLSTHPKAVVVTIGACIFSTQPGQEAVLNKKQWTVNMHDAQRHGLHIDANTVMWWLKQGHDARMALVNSVGQTLASALDGLVEYCKLARSNHPRGELNVWGNDPTFDCVILEHSFAAADVACPWNYYETRSVRTQMYNYYELFGKHAKQEFPRQGTHHNAEDDAVYQAELVSSVVNAIRSAIK